MMIKLYLIFGIFCLVLCDAYSPPCIEITNDYGTIEHSSFRIIDLCWTIKVPTNRFLQLSVLRLELFQDCPNYKLQITVEDTNENYIFCQRDSSRNPVKALSGTRIQFQTRENTYRYINKLSLKYEIRDIECTHKDSFHCSNSTCIPKIEVCDGVKDCEDGADEVGCETGVASISGVSDARSKAVAWLKKRRTLSWGWQENTPRGVIALYLGNGAKFNGSNLEEELMAKQTALKTSVALRRNPVMTEVLSTFINSLLVTCNDPRNFFGQDLVTRLKKQIESSPNFTHPIAYLALCNANETWPLKGVSDMKKLLNGNSHYAFDRDYQAFTVIALSCYENRTELLSKAENANLKSLYQRTVQKFKENQLDDGSFGNLHSTALITQALISSGHENSRDWKLNSTIHYLMKRLDSTDIDFVSVYLTLPVLNRKSLSDIGKVNCTSNWKKNQTEGILSQIHDYIGPMMRIQYSIFVGDEKDIIHTLFLRVPQNFTAFEVMKLAQEEDQKYNFHWKTVSDKMYVDQIGNVMNDPEAGYFWLLYTGSTNSTESLKHSFSGPNDLVLDERDHLVMWYKRALY